jgi:neutral ceramidase
MAKLGNAGRWLLLPLVSYLLLLVDWRGSMDPPAPRLRRVFDVSAPLSAGAARVRLAPSLPAVRAGYGPTRAVADRELDPLEVRALVLRAGGHSLAIVLADIVLVPEDLARALESRVADLAMDAVVLVATHTHSSVGGFDRRVLAQVAGMGRYRAEVLESLLGRAEAAVRQAVRHLVPVQVRTAQARVSGWAVNRSTPGGPVDDALTVAELVGGAGERVATIAIVAAHPTLLPRTAPRLSADYPGAAMRRLEAAGGTAFVLQGAHGDARPARMGAAAIEAEGAFVAGEVASALEGARPAGGRLAHADVEIGTPSAELQRVRFFFLRRPASNLLQWMVPSASRVTVVTVGDLVVLGVPGEPTALAAARMVAALPRAAVEGRKVRVVALVQGYLGYIDTPERVQAGRGEGRRAWFAPELLEAVTRGLQVGVSPPSP